MQMTFLRILAFIFHLLQVVISIIAGLYISAVIAALAGGVYLHNFQTIRRLYHVSPLVISSVGTIAWIIAAVVEISLLDGNHP